MRLALLLLALAACSGQKGGTGTGTTRPPDPVQTPPVTTDPGAPIDVDPTPPVTPPPVEQGRKADGASCVGGEECSSGVCEGQGCGDDQPGKCMPKARPCTRDLRTYCGCDGKTFQASGSCPGRRFSLREKCDRS